jgi:hypothetical protein
VVALYDRRQERAQQERVADGDEVHRRSHQREAHDLAVDEQPAQLVRIEALEARPQAVVGRHRRLRLEPEQVLESIRDRQLDAMQQELALEQRAVERTRAEQLFLRDRHALHNESGAAR